MHAQFLCKENIKHARFTQSLDSLLPWYILFRHLLKTDYLIFPGSPLLPHRRRAATAREEAIRRLQNGQGSRAQTERGEIVAKVAEEQRFGGFGGGGSSGHTGVAGSGSLFSLGDCDAAAGKTVARAGIKVHCRLIELAAFSTERVWNRSQYYSQSYV